MRWYRVALDGGREALGYEDNDCIHLVDAPDLYHVMVGLPYNEVGVKIDIEQAKLLAPYMPRKIIAVGLNYADHCEEDSSNIPESPVIFSKFLNTVNGPYSEISWAEGTTDKVDFEAELGVVVGKTVKGVSQSDAIQAVFGYVVANDVSARDVQLSDGQWVRGKSFDGFCPFGPCVTTRSDIEDVQRLDISCAVNGIRYQDSNTANMIFDVKYLVSFLSQSMTLEPGDLILTGTPEGVGNFQTPPVFMRKGDIVRVEIERLGAIENPIAGPI